VNREVGREEKGSIQEAQYKVFAIFRWKGKGVEALTETRAAGQNWREYGAENMGGVEDNRIQQIKFRRGGKIIE